MHTPEKQRIEDILSYMPPEDRAFIAPLVRAPESNVGAQPRSRTFQQLLSCPLDHRVSRLAALIKADGVPSDFPQCLVILPDLYWLQPTHPYYRNDHAVLVDAALTGPVFPLAWSGSPRFGGGKKKDYMYENPLHYTNRLRTYIMDSGLPPCLCDTNQSDTEDALVVPLILVRRSVRVLGQPSMWASRTQDFVLGLAVGAVAAAPILVSLKNWLYSS
jgi:hypothetical protein